jgi:hypothetical protein
MASDTKDGPTALDLLSAATAAGLVLVPHVGGLIAPFAPIVIEAGRARVTEFAERTRQEVGDDGLFVDRLAENEQLRDQLVYSSWDASRTTLRAKRLAMGRALGQAMLDDEQIDDTAALLSTLAVLEAPHFKFLAQVEAAEPIPPTQQLVFPEPYDSVIQSHGLVTLSLDGGNALGAGGMYPITLSPFGRTLLAYVREAQDECGEDDPLPRA